MIGWFAFAEHIATTIQNTLARTTTVLFTTTTTTCVGRRGEERIQTTELNPTNRFGLRDMMMGHELDASNRKHLCTLIVLSIYYNIHQYVRLTSEGWLDKDSFLPSL